MLLSNISMKGGLLVFYAGGGWGGDSDQRGVIVALGVCTVDCVVSCEREVLFGLMRLMRMDG